MKKQTLVALATISMVSSVFAGPFVGVEREMGKDMAGLNRAYVGASFAVSDRTNVTLQANGLLNAPMQDSTFEKAIVSVDYKLTPKSVVYMSNELNKDVQRSKTTIGARYNF